MTRFILTGVAGLIVWLNSLFPSRNPRAWLPRRITLWAEDYLGILDP